jgi:hypothetical protein
MTITPVELESLSNKSRFVTLVQKNNAGTYAIAGSDYPLIVADINHVRLHEGRAFYAYKLNPHATPLAAGSSIDLAVAWASDKTPHLVFDCNCGGDAEFYIYENAVVTGGTPFTAINRHRPSDNVSQSAVLINPTVTSVGNELHAEMITGGTGKKAGGAAAFSFQHVLSPLTTYLFRLTNVNSTSHMAFLQIAWYE